jgi:hypothetical protein
VEISAAASDDVVVAAYQGTVIPTTPATILVKHTFDDWVQVQQLLDDSQKERTSTTSTNTKTWYTVYDATTTTMSFTSVAVETGDGCGPSGRCFGCYEY